MDKRNPQIAARLLGVFEIWPKLDESRREQILTILDKIVKSKPSKNLLEIASRIRG